MRGITDITDRQTGPESMDRGPCDRRGSPLIPFSACCGFSAESAPRLWFLGRRQKVESRAYGHQYPFDVSSLPWVKTPDPWSSRSWRVTVSVGSLWVCPEGEWPEQLDPSTVFFQIQASSSVSLGLGESTPPEPSSISATQANIKFDMIWRLIMQ